MSRLRRAGSRLGSGLTGTARGVAGQARRAANSRTVKTGKVMAEIAGLTLNPDPGALPPSPPPQPVVQAVGSAPRPAATTPENNAIDKAAKHLAEQDAKRRTARAERPVPRATTFITPPKPRSRTRRREERRPRPRRATTRSRDSERSRVQRIRQGASRRRNRAPDRRGRPTRRIPRTKPRTRQYVAGKPHQSRRTRGRGRGK
ncbi:hypothetical protein GCM10025792_49320 [Pseudonocardia tropica]